MAKFWIYPESSEGGDAWSSGTFADIDDPYAAWDDDTTFMSRTSAGSDDFATRFNLTPFVPSATAINSVTGGVRMKRTAGAGGQFTAGVRIGGTNYYGSLGNFSGSYANRLTVWTVNPATAAAWTVTELNALIGLSRTTAPGTGRTFRWTGLWFEIDYVGAPATLVQASDAAARRVHTYASPRNFVSFSAPLHVLLDLKPGSFVRVKHFGGPRPEGYGWGFKPWQNRLVRVHDVTIRPGQAFGTVRAHDIRPRLVYLRDDAWTTQPANALGDGIIRLSKNGAVRTYERASNTWVDDPASRLYMQLSDNQEPHNHDGMSFFGASTNHIQQSGFQTGDITGWTKNGTGTNGSAITRNTDDPGVWEPNSTGVNQTFTILAGTPHATDTYLLSTTTGSISANTKLWFSLWSKTVAGDPVRYTVVRGIDGLYWRASDQTWLAGPIWNPVTATAGAWARWLEPNQIDVGAGATTLAVRVGYENAAADTSESDVSAILLETGTIPSWAPILTASATYTRVADSYHWAQDVWNAGAFGGFLCEVIPNWGPATIGNTNKTVFRVSHDASNWEWCYYDGTNDRWVFERRVAATTYRATFSHTPIKGVAYRIGCRFTGSEAEEDVTAFTASIFVGTSSTFTLFQGTDVVTGAAPTPVTSYFLELGSNAGAEHFDGVMRLFRFTPYVPNFHEMTRLYSLVG
jgi:hypothetical protein